jgi:hypothetical protein
MTAISRVTAQNTEIYRQTEIKKLDKRHEEQIQDDRRVKERREDNEAKRIEMNRQMNRPGQNVDRMA